MRLSIGQFVRYTLHRQIYHTSSIPINPSFSSLSYISFYFVIASSSISIAVKKIMNETLREGGKKEGFICKRYRYIEPIIYQVLSILFSYKIYETVICVNGKQILGTTFTFLRRTILNFHHTECSTDRPRKSSNTLTVLAFEKFILSHVILLREHFGEPRENGQISERQTYSQVSIYFYLNGGDVRVSSQIHINSYYFNISCVLFLPRYSFFPYLCYRFLIHRNHCFVIIESCDMTEITLCSKLDRVT